jgi:hypothetical protein
VSLESIELAEGPRVQQQIDPLARGQLTFLVAALDSLGPTPELRSGVELV